MLFDSYLLLVLGLLNNSQMPSYLNWIKPSNHVMISNPKHVSTLLSYVVIINGIFPNWIFKKKQQTQTQWRLKTSLSCTA